MEFKQFRKLLALTVAVAMVLAMAVPCFGHTQSQVESAVTDTAKYIYNLAKAEGAGVSDVGGEWAVMTLARSGYDVPDDFYQSYYENVEKYVKEKEKYRKTTDLRK